MPETHEPSEDDRGAVIRCSCGSWSMLFRNSFGLDARREFEVHVENARLRDQIAVLRSLVDELVDDDPCLYDHNDYCQGHSLHRRPCPHERAKELLADA